VRAIVGWLSSQVISVVHRLRTGEREIINAFHSDWNWVFRDGQTVLPKAVSALPTFLFWFTSASNLDLFFKPGRWRKNFKDLYAGGIGILLSGLLLAWRLVPCWALCVIAGYRAFDIFIYRAYFLLVKGHRIRPWSDRDKVKRGIVFALVNWYEIVIAYAIIYLVSRQIVHTVGKDTVPLGSRMEALYFSIVTSFTFGPGDFSPDHDLMRFIMMIQITTSVLFLIFIIPALISLFSANTDREG
jgi:hypothetical protein